MTTRHALVPSDSIINGDAPGFDLELTGGTISDKPTAPEPRPLHQIAFDIRMHWPKVNFAAQPYLDALRDLDSIDDMYICDTGRSIVAYFLSNATSWRGEDARRIKAELKAMQKATA